MTSRKLFQWIINNGSKISGHKIHICLRLFLLPFHEFLFVLGHGQSRILFESFFFTLLGSRPTDSKMEQKALKLAVKYPSGSPSNTSSAKQHHPLLVNSSPTLVKFHSILPKVAIWSSLFIHWMTACGKLNFFVFLPGTTWFQLGFRGSLCSLVYWLDGWSDRMRHRKFIFNQCFPKVFHTCLFGIYFMGRRPTAVVTNDGVMR